MNNYFICVQSKESQGYIVIKGPSSFDDIDRTTTVFENRDDLINCFKINIPSLPSIENVESVYILKQGETRYWNLGEVFYSKNKDVKDKDENIEKLIEKTKDRQFLMQFLKRYISMAEQERGYVPFEEEINGFINCVQQMEDLDCHAKFVELLKVMTKHYGVYRFVYSVNKTFEEEKLNEKPNVKCKTSKVGTIGRRIKETR